jgi:hypothetical protein
MLNDKILQKASKIIENLEWKDFSTVGIEDFYFDYYYAESGLYLIKDRINDSIYFVWANNPGEARSKAFEKFISLGEE